MARSVTRSHLYDLWAHASILRTRAGWAGEAERDLLLKEAENVAREVGQHLGKVPDSDEEFVILVRRH